MLVPFLRLKHSQHVPNPRLREHNLYYHSLKHMAKSRAVWATKVEAVNEYDADGD